MCKTSRRPDGGKLFAGSIEPDKARRGPADPRRVHEQALQDGEVGQSCRGKPLDIVGQHDGVAPDLEGLWIAGNGHEGVGAPKEQIPGRGIGGTGSLGQDQALFLAVERGHEGGDRDGRRARIGSSLSDLVEETAAVGEKARPAVGTFACRDIEACRRGGRSSGRGHPHERSEVFGRVDDRPVLAPASPARLHDVGQLARRRRRRRGLDHLQPSFREEADRAVVGRPEGEEPAFPSRRGVSLQCVELPHPQAVGAIRLPHAEGEATSVGRNRGRRDVGSEEVKGRVGRRKEC